MITKKEIVTCTCDICKKEVAGENKLKQIKLPCHCWSPNSFYIYDCAYGVKEITLDACEDCVEKIIRKLEEILRYGFYDYHGYECDLKDNKTKDGTE